MTYDPIRGVSGAIGTARASLNDLRNLITGRPGALPCSFRGVPFFGYATVNSFGRRMAAHQFPKYDIPYMEDMGRRAREFQIQGFVVGRDWERERNDLIAACETPQAGTLMHPDYGEFEAICESCAVSESRVGALFRADFDLRFIESGKNAIPPVVINPALAIRNAIADIYGIVKDALTLAYVVSRLPGTLKSQFQTFLGISTATVRDVPNNAVQRAVRAVDETDIESTAVVDRVMAIPVSITTELVTRNLRETSGTITAIAPVGDSSAITPYQALTLLDEIISVDTQLPLGNTPRKRLLRQSIQATDVALKAAAAVEFTRVVTYIDFTSLDEAQSAWTRTLANLDTVMRLAADAGHDEVYQSLSSQKALVNNDIRVRAPTLDRIVYREVKLPTPALVIAYREYGDTSRELQIVTRNQIRHPGFVASGRLELIKPTDE